ncbi:MAG: hypothetical protein IPO99_10170 [Nitrospira sp.]|nr:hypothetical protein [Nitrospira sp.]
MADRWGGLPVLVGVFIALCFDDGAGGVASGATWAVGLLVVTIAVIEVQEWGDFSNRLRVVSKDIGLASGLVGAASGISGFLVPIGFRVAAGKYPGTFLFGFVGLAIRECHRGEKRLTVAPALRWRPQAIAQAKSLGGFFR